MLIVVGVDGGYAAVIVGVIVGIVMMIARYSGEAGGVPRLDAAPVRII